MHRFLLSELGHIIATIVDHYGKHVVALGSLLMKGVKVSAREKGIHPVM